MTETTATLTVPRRIYYGWVIVGVAALAMVGTLPGRTQGLGLITEPLLGDLGIGRVAYAQVNLFATLVGALFAYGVGSLLDRRGSRVVLTAIAILLGLVVLAMSQVSGVVPLLVAVTFTRGLGQTALSIVSLAMVGKWFQRRLTWAMGIYALAMSIGFMIAFPIVGAVVLAHGWRLAWAAIGLALVAGLAPMAWTLVRATPDTIGEVMDGDRAARPEAVQNPAPVAAGERMAESATLAEALRSPAFWVFGLASS
ncbi:MAG TPA: MFS transporter, partial [Candidatus Limnocylindria bacterium]|nr:MFS transporter [Candidatus Limnocylindria bacterium]